MKTQMRLRAVALVVVALLWALPAMAQTNLRGTTLSAAVTTTAVTTIQLASVSGVAVNTSVLYVDNELMTVTAISGLTVSVTRGANGTRAMTHASGASVTVAPPAATIGYRPVGSCTIGVGLARFSAVIFPVDGTIWACRSSLWTGTTTQNITFNSTNIYGTP